MERQKSSSCTLLAAAAISLGALLLNGCSTTPDESYKESKMTRPLDYPPDLVAPTLSERFSVPSPDAAPVTTPITLPAPSAPHKPASRGGGGGHSH